MTSNDKHTFFPKEAENGKHLKAITRRMHWVNVTEKPFKEEESETQAKELLGDVVSKKQCAAENLVPDDLEATH